jgi:hypothetical protein
VPAPPIAGGVTRGDVVVDRFAHGVGDVHPVGVSDGREFRGFRFRQAQVQGFVRHPIGVLDRSMDPPPRSLSTIGVARTYGRAVLGG